MTYIIHCILFCLVPYCRTDFVSTNRKAPSYSHCEGSEKNAVIERFFNIIFTEFHATPPVCVCVQMCAGQSTYCYPNACLKRDDLRRVDAPEPSPEVPATVVPERKFLFLVDENPNLGPGFVEDDKQAEIVSTTKKSYSSDFFKDFKTFKKFRKHLPQVELRYNLRESIKNLKSDVFKMENVDLSKTRWPMNKYNVVSGHRRASPEIASPVVGKTKFFISMLSDNNVAYPPKYFKRELIKSSDDLSNNKEVYVYENIDNFTSFSLETLIDNLIKINVETNPDLLSILNSTEPKQVEDISVELSVIPLNYSERIQEQENTKSTDILSINMTQETIDKNKYTEQNGSKNFNGMISTLAKRIEKQNNTSMEMAKRLVADLDYELTTEDVIKNTKPVTEELNTEIESNKTFKSSSTETTLKTRDDEITPTTAANVIEATVTRKVKLRLPRKLGSKTTN